MCRYSEDGKLVFVRGQVMLFNEEWVIKAEVGN